MNCFQIVSLTYWAQHFGGDACSKYCCELLSDCIFDLLSTTAFDATPDLVKLWIAFRLYLWPTEHNYGGKRSMARFSCELLSDCIFDLLSTTTQNFIVFYLLLWIAFRLYLWPTEHNVKCVKFSFVNVVNCFQIVSLTYWAQPRPTESANGVQLWIAFRLYLWPTEHNFASSCSSAGRVVNCFQIVSLTYWAQHQMEQFELAIVVNCFQIVSLTYWAQRTRWKELVSTRCELLSDCIFDLLSTTCFVANIK